MITCPDCGKTGANLLVHEQTCPFGRAVDERIAADRRWFAAHPFAAGYRRAPDWTETAEARLLGLLAEGEEVSCRTVVRVPAPGLVLREIGGVLLATCPCRAPWTSAPMPGSTKHWPSGWVVTRSGRTRRCCGCPGH